MWQTRPILRILPVKMGVRLWFVTNEREVELVETALQDSRFNSVTTHLKTALRLLADREKPDYRNSVKESISAVEAMGLRCLSD